MRAYSLPNGAPKAQCNSLGQRPRYYSDIPIIFDQRQDGLDQYRAIGWAGGRLYSVILEIREDKAGEYFHLVTLWKATRGEQMLYEKNL